MYNIPISENGGIFFNFREMGGLLINKVADIPYDFYALIPTRLQPLYQEMRRERQWMAGYVPGIHDRLLSSKIVSAINNALTNRVVGSGFKFDGEDYKVDILDTYKKKNDLDDIVSALTINGNNVGQCFIKIDRVNGEIKPCIVPSDQAFWTFERGKIVDFKSVVTFNANNDKNSSIFLMEHRFYKDGKAYIRHFFTDTNNQFTENADDLKNFRKGMNLSVPLLNRFGIEAKVGQNFKNLLKDMGVYVDPEELDFKNGIAVEIYRSTEQNPTYIKYPFGSGLVAQMGEDNLVKYELANSLSSHELNVAPQIVLVPQGFNNGRINDPFKSGGMFYQDNYQSSAKPTQIRQTYYVLTPFSNADGTQAEPKSIAFDIRSGDILAMKTSALKDLCINAGVSPSDLSIGGEKAVYVSNKQSSNQQDLTVNTIKSKRRRISKCISLILSEVLYNLGIENDSDISILWLDLDAENFENQISTYETAIKNFVMSPEEAIRRLYPNKTKRELAKLMQEIEVNREKIMQTYYGGVNQNNKEKQSNEDNKE